MNEDASSNLFPASNIKQEQIEVEDDDEADSSRLGINFNHSFQARIVSLAKMYFDQGSSNIAIF
jgi:hypothetical protein